MNTAIAEPSTREPSRRVQGPMDRRAQGAAGARKGADAPARPDRPRAPRAAVGSHREELRLRRTRRPAHARRAVRRPPPTAGAALHVRPGVGARLPELLLHGRPHRRHERAPGASRRHVAWSSRARRWPRSSAFASAWAGSSSGCPRMAATSTTTSASASRRKNGPRARSTTTTACSPFRAEEAPGISVFYKDDAGEVFHTYSTYGRGVEVMMGTYNLLDLTPKGRDEHDPGSDGMGAPPRSLRAGIAAEAGGCGQFVLRRTPEARRPVPSTRHGKPLAMAGGRRARRPSRAEPCHRLDVCRRLGRAVARPGAGAAGPDADRGRARRIGRARGRRGGTRPVDGSRCAASPGGRAACRRRDRSPVGPHTQAQRARRRDMPGWRSGPS